MLRIVTKIDFFVDFCSKNPDNKSVFYIIKSQLFLVEKHYISNINHDSTLGIKSPAQTPFF